VKILSLIIHLLLVGSVFGQIVDGASTVNVRNAATGGNMQVGTAIFYPERYGAIAGDLLDDKAAIQSAIDAAEAAGGGIVQLGKGRYRVSPLATQIGLLVDSEYVLLRGLGEATEIMFITATASNGAAFCGIAPKRYNTCTSPYTAAPLWIENLRLTADAYTGGLADECHDLVGIVHCPWAILRNVGFGMGYYHCFEINVSKNVLVEDCYTYGTCNFGSNLIQFDSLGSAGAIAGGGTHSASTPNSNITIRRFIQRSARQDLTIDFGASHTAGVEGILLSHTNALGVLRNVTIEGCRFIPHRHPTVATGNSRNVIGFDNAALPLECTNLTIDGNTFVGDQGDTPGGIAGTHVFVHLGAASTATRRIRNVKVMNNLFDGSWYFPLILGAGNSDATSRTTIAVTTLESHQNILVEGNTFVCGLNANDTDGGRTPKGVWVGASRSVVARNNNYTVPNQAVGAGWTASDFVNTGSFGFYFDHVQELTVENNHVEMAMPIATMTWNFTAYAFAWGGFEVSSVPANTRVVGNVAHGNGTIGGNMSCYFAEVITTGTTGMPQWADKDTPFVTGEWRGNFGTTGGTVTQNLSASHLIPLSALTSQGSAVSAATAAAIGVHDLRPQDRDIGTFATAQTGATLSDGWTLLDGANISTLGWLEQANWNIRLGLSATTALPTTSDTYVRLTGK
jgi:hypothetical protein